MNEFRVKVGKKVDKSEVDKSRCQDLKVTPPESTDIEGQARRYQIHICPWCGAIGYAWETPDIFNQYQCWKCRGGSRQ